MASNNQTLKIIPLGGCEEVGRNMTVFEYQGDILILDMGLQFPEEDMPGIDYIIPNIKYLQGKERQIRGVIFSHGHLDHIGAAPILLERLGNPPVVGREMTLALLKHRQEDYKKGTAGHLHTIPVKNLRDSLTLGKFKVSFFQVEHSIVDAVGVIIETPAAIAIHPGDWSLERDDYGYPSIDYRHLRQLRKPTVLMLESLGSTRNDLPRASREVYDNLRKLMTEAPGRVIIGTFASQVSRLQWILETAHELGKKVVLEGRSMKVNVEIAKRLGYIKAPQNSIIDVAQINRYPDKKVVVVCTGAQGEKEAVLSRIVDREHRLIRLKKSDTVIFSSSVIPGNERTIQRLKDAIYRQSDYVYHSEIMDVHVSGHATRHDILQMLDMIQPTYFLPVYANHYFLKEAARLAIGHGFPAERILVPDNGSVILVDRNQFRLLDKKVPTDYVFVDGLGVSDAQNVVLRDRQVLAEDGMVVLIVTVNAKTGRIVLEPDIISRGFIYLKENKQLFEEVKIRVRKIVSAAGTGTRADIAVIKNNIRDRIGQYLFSKTEKRPMILPVVIEV